MRASDSAKGSTDFAKAFHGSHDQQIGGSKHDEIVLWVYQKAIEAAFFKKELGLDDTLSVSDIKRIIEYPLYRDSRILGFADLAVIARINKGDGWQQANLFIEAKTSVNVGETIRQIRYYHQSNNFEYSQKSKWIVCAPDFASKNILIEQGIGFIPYEP